MIPTTITTYKFPKHILSILSVLGKQGLQAYIVGGAIRDILRGHHPTEYDIASNASPSMIESLFTHTIPTGKAYGTITVRIDGHSVEITTFRSESAYTNARHPLHVSFEAHIAHDLSRRDFTINAIAANPLTNEFHDPFNGQTHIKENRITCVGNPINRLSEDTLRIFRAFRFIAQLNMTLCPDTKTAIQQIPSTRLPAKERIQKELNTLLQYDQWWEALSVMIDCDWYHMILPTAPTIAPPKRLCSTNERWAWLLQNHSQQIPSNLIFSKKEYARFNALKKYNFDESMLCLTTHDLCISSSELMARGFSNQSLGNIQKELLHLVRSNALKNRHSDIITYLEMEYRC